MKSKIHTLLNILVTLYFIYWYFVVTIHVGILPTG